MPKPKVSILLPVLNEAAYIDACLSSLASQDYDGETEIIVADGGSEDGTLDLIEAWKSTISHLKVIDNSDKVQSNGLSRAAERATGEILIRVDAHSTYTNDYIRLSVETLLGTDATAVGGVQTPRGIGAFGRAVATAMKMPMATGPAGFRHAKTFAEVDTVYLGAFRREDLMRLGSWRTLPSRVAEDADLYFRWREQGARIFVDPAIKSTYRPRDTVSGLCRQYYRYGLGKADMLYINGRWPSWRPTAPLALVVGLSAAAVAGVVWSWWPLVGLLALWQSALAIAAKGRPLVILAASVMHMAYGIGLIRGLIRRPSWVRATVA